MPLVRLETVAAGVRLGIWRILETEEELLGAGGAPVLDIPERLRTTTRRRHWLAARVLLRRMAGAGVGFEADAEGRPRIVGAPGTISLAHCGDYAVALLSARAEVGIDIERIGPEVLEIADRFMAPDETVSREDRETLTACWCAKEAVYKLQGRRGVSFREMTIEPFALGSDGVLVLSYRGVRFTVAFERIEDYVLAYAIDGL